MFDFVHKNKRILQVVLGLMIIPFAFFGLESYTRSGAGADEVANVAGRTISQREFTEELRQQMQRLQGVFGRNFDTSTFDTPQARADLLEGLINREVLAMAAAKANLTVGDEQLRELISGIQAFQIDGQFSKEQYKTLLAAQNMTETQFEARLRYDLAISQLNRALSGSAMQSRTVADRLFRLEEQKREVSEALVPAQPLLAQVKIDEAQLKANYEANQSGFRSEELVKAEFVVLSAEQIGALDPVTDAELRAAYESRAAEYRQDEQRRASHILIQVAPDAKPADKEAARSKVEGMLAELKKSPARFADLARKNSQDPGSAEKGGDLGFFARGMMVKVFEDVAFKLKDGETSGVVESEFGYHIIRVTGVRAGKTRAFEEVRAELAREFAKQKGARKFAEAAETFSNLVYEQSDSLNAVAERFKLQVQRTDWISRAPAQSGGPLANPKLLGALFSADSIQAKRNTDAVEVAQNVLVSARVVEHKPAAQLKFEEVRADIERNLRIEQAAKLAQKDGADRLEKLKAGTADAGLKWSAPRTITRRSAAGVRPEALSQILAADAAKLPAYVGVPISEGYLLYRVGRVIEAEAGNEEQKKALLARLDGQVGSEQFDAYIAGLRSRSKVEINKANLEKKQP
jgi:peptidyl-prolyl cis-trans isomerase D